MSEAVLSLRAFGVQIGPRVILDGVDLDVPARGVTALMGPGGAGKSTLLRTLSGLYEGVPAARLSGEAAYRGRPLGAADRPVLLAQNARAAVSSVFDALASAFPDRADLTRPEMRERLLRCLAEAGYDHLGDRLDDDTLALPHADRLGLGLLRTVAADPPLVCLDEPTAALDPAEAERPLAFIIREARRRAVLLVTHHQGHARAVADTVALLAGGRVHGQAPTARFFADPPTPAARQFVRTGGCAVPSPGARPEELDPEVVGALVPPPVASLAVPAAPPPRGFRWLLSGRLAGTPCPGLFGECERDLAGLAAAGVTHLVTLTERPLDPAPDPALGLTTRHFPVVDMAAPTCAAADALLADLARITAAGGVVALHCKAGLGRTGTLLAAWLVRGGRSPDEALRAVRNVEPRWVQSIEQVAFLHHYARWRATRPPAPLPDRSQGGDRSPAALPGPTIEE